MSKAMDLLMWNLEVDRPRQGAAGDLGARREGCRASTGSACARCAAASCAKTWTPSPRSTTPPGRRTGTSCRTPRRTSTRYAQELQLVFDKHWFMIAERKTRGEVVGMAITVPDINQVLEQMNGRLLPFGWWHFLRKGRIIDRVRVGFLGVKPEYQHTGVAAKLYEVHFDAAEAPPPEGRRDGLDPRDQHGDEPRHGSDGRADRQALPDLRAELSSSGLDRPLHSAWRRRDDRASDRTGARGGATPLPVLAPGRRGPRRRAVHSARSRRRRRRRVQAAAAAAGGFVAGAAVVGLVGAASAVRHAGRRAAARSSAGPPRGARERQAARESSCRSSAPARCWSTCTCSAAGAER